MTKVNSFLATFFKDWREKWCEVEAEDEVSYAYTICLLLPNQHDLEPFWQNGWIKLVGNDRSCVRWAFTTFLYLQDQEDQGGQHRPANTTKAKHQPSATDTQQQIKEKRGGNNTALNRTRETASPSKLPQVTSSSYVYRVQSNSKGGNNMSRLQSK